MENTVFLYNCIYNKVEKLESLYHVSRREEEKKSFIRGGDESVLC